MGEKLARLWAAFTSSLGVRRYIVANIASLVLLGYGRAREMLAASFPLPDIPSWFLWLAVVIAIAFIAALNRVAQLEKRAEPAIAIRYEKNHSPYEFHKLRPAEEISLYRIGVENVCSSFLINCRMELVSNVNKAGKTSNFVPCTFPSMDGNGTSAAFALSVGQEARFDLFEFINAVGLRKLELLRTGGLITLPKTDHTLILRAYADNGLPVDASFQISFNEGGEVNFERISKP